MPLQKLSLSTLSDLDAGGVLAFEKLLSRAASDCLDRPNDPTARKITLELEVTPVLEQDLTCSEAKIRFHATAKLPTSRKPWSGSLKCAASRLSRRHARVQP